MCNIKKTVLAMAALMATVTGSVHASTVSYFLDQTNSAYLADGTNYAKVTISDEGVAGNIDFSVEVNESEFTFTNPDAFGMQSFGFNYNTEKASLASISASNIDNLNPATWTISQDKGGFGDFGKFEFKLAGKGHQRTSLLTFSITGIDGDSIEDYAIGNMADPKAYFAAHIAGYEIDGESETSAMFGTVVPVPAAAWLFGSGLIGLVGVARRSAS